MLFGGRASYSTFEPFNLGEYMRPRMTHVFPQLKDVKIDHAWGGYIAITSNRIPDCGRLSPTVYYAHGYSGQGVALTGLYGKLMAEAIRGTAERFDLLAKIKHLPFPGGPMRTRSGGGDDVLPHQGRAELKQISNRLLMATGHQEPDCWQRTPMASSETTHRRKVVRASPPVAADGGN
jgi:hypothetical protein